MLLRALRLAFSCVVQKEMESNVREAVERNREGETYDGEDTGGRG